MPQFASVILAMTLTTVLMWVIVPNLKKKLQNQLPILTNKAPNSKTLGKPCKVTKFSECTQLKAQVILRVSKMSLLPHNIRDGPLYF